MDKDEVVIIGAGICGLATALALQKKGIKSIVMERSESLRNTTGAAIGIRQNGWRALHHLGLAHILRPTAIATHSERMVSLDDGKEQRLPMIGETRCLKRKDLIDALYNALPTTIVKFGCELESIKLDPITTKPVLRFIDGTSIIAKVVIGCDGSKSVVSNFLNLNSTERFPLCVVRGLTNYPNGHSYGHEFARLKKGNTLLGRVPFDDKLMFWFCVQPYNIHRDERTWEDSEVIRRSTIELLSDYPKEIQEMIESTDVTSLSFAHLRYHTPWDLLTGTYCKGTITVAGDAMHVMGPFLGQGVSTCLEDAIVLARNLAQTGLNRGATGSKVTSQGVVQALNIYVKQRRMRVVRFCLQAYLIGMLLGTSYLKKIIYITLLFLLFHNPNGYIDYDCGDL